MAMTSSTLAFSRILVTGANGFVGRQLVPALAARLRPEARLVRAVQRLGPDAAGQDQIAFDLADPAGIREAIEAIRPDLVIHLAAQSSVGRSAGAAAGTWSTNLCGSLWLAAAMADLVPGCTLLFASSVEVYGLTFNHETVTEASPLRPQSPYARSKAAAEVMFDDVLPASARLIVARPCNHSGPGQEETFVIPAFAAQVAEVERGASPLIRVGNLEAERDFLDVRDVVSAYLALLEHADGLPLRSTFNIASGQPVQIGVVLDRLRALSTVKTVVEQDPQRLRPSEVSKTAILATALEQAVGWAPEHTLDEMLTRVLAAKRAPA